ncbi:DNA polymerase [Specibacter sp. RAF43]|uniref:DNA polymerase n=1 Tax=Specibacter sp. RAF43 TaxID=3233057 RepID=UPI003F945121
MSHATLIAQDRSTGVASLLFLPAGAEVHEFDRWLRANKTDVLGFDTETTGLDFHATDFDVRQVCFGTSTGHAVVIDGSDTELVVGCLTAAVKSGRQIWAHNATYDAGAVFTRYRVRLRKLRCSLVLTRALAPDTIATQRGSLKDLRPATQDALNRLAGHYMQRCGRALLERSEHSWLPGAVALLGADDPILLEYVATDAIECARLVEDWRDESTEARTGDSVLAATAQWKAAMMETRIEDLWRWPAARGYRLDMAELGHQLGRLETSRHEGALRHGVDLTANSEATRQWIRSRGIRIQDPDGKVTLSHKHYKQAFVPNDAAEDWADFKAIREVAQTASKLSELMERQVGGRIYPSIRAIGAVTGRMSIGKPAIQNIPTALRKLLLAEENHVLVGCDLNRVEPCVLAAMSQDEALMEAVMGDVYIELAVAVYGEENRERIIAESRSDAGSPERKIAKTALLAMIYGQGPTSLARNLSITSSDAREVINSLRRAYPTMNRWINDVKYRAKRGDAMSTFFGRPLAETRDKPYRMVNWTVQGTAADLFKQITLRVAAGLPRDALYLPVHDELVVQVPAGLEQNALQVLGDAMTTEMAGVPITGTPVILGPRLGHA